jgi:hypothetical protein
MPLASSLSFLSAVLYQAIDEDNRAVIMLCDVLLLSWWCRIVEQRIDDDFVLFNTLKHLVLQQHLLARDLTAFRAVLGTMTSAPASETMQEPMPLPSEKPVSDKGGGSVSHRTAQMAKCDGSVLREASKDWFTAVEAAVERAMGDVRRGLHAVQCAVADLAETRDADRRALKAPAAASTASAAAAASSGAGEVDGLVGALRDASWHCRQFMAKRREPDLLADALAHSDALSTARGVARQKLPLGSTAAGGMEKANTPGTQPETGKQVQSAAPGNSGYLRTWVSSSSLPVREASLSSGPARQMAASLAAAATTPAGEDKRRSGTRRRGGDAADGGRHPSTLAQKSRLSDSALALSVQDVTAGTEKEHRKGAAIDGGGHGAGAVVFAGSEFSTELVKQSLLKRADRRDGSIGRHQAQPAHSSAALTSKHSVSFSGVGSVSARGSAKLSAAGNLPLSSGRGQSVLEVPILPASGSDVVLARRR